MANHFISGTHKLAGFVTLLYNRLSFAQHDKYALHALIIYRMFMRCQATLKAHQNCTHIRMAVT